MDNLLTLAIFAIPHIVGSASGQVQGPHDDHALRFLQAKRGAGSISGRFKCSFPMPDEPIMRTRDSDVPFDSNRTLVARTMRLPDPMNDGAAAMKEFMSEELEDLTRKLIWSRMVAGKPEDFAAAVFEMFQDHSALSIGTDGLCGCTVLAIVSRKAVYMAHYWESISFAPDPFWERRFRDTFEDTVVRGLTRGVRKEQASLRVNSHYFGNDHVRAYLLHPTEPAEDFMEGVDRQEIFEKYHLKRWDRIREVVIDLVPAIGQPGRWIDLEYDALDKEDPKLDDTALGRVLFKYDPDHRYTSSDGTEMTQQKAAFWVQANVQPEHDDTWDDEPLS